MPLSQTPENLDYKNKNPISLNNKSNITNLFKEAKNHFFVKEKINTTDSISLHENTIKKLK